MAKTCIVCGAPLQASLFGRPPTKFCCREHLVEYQVAEVKQALDYFRSRGQVVHIERQEDQQQVGSAA